MTEQQVASSSSSSSRPAQSHLSIGSKYANLPDIDTSADVYETEDVIGVTSAAYDKDAESDDSLTQIRQSSSANPRRGRGETSGSTDPDGLESAHLPRVKAVGRKFERRRRRDDDGLPLDPDVIHKAASDRAADWMLRRSARESDAQRLRRLQLEMKELESHLRQRAGTEPPSNRLDQDAETEEDDDDDENDGDGGLFGVDVFVSRIRRRNRKEPSASELLQRLDALKSRSSEMDASENSARTTGGAPSEDYVQPLLQRLQELGSAEAGVSEPDSSNSTSLGSADAAELDKRVNSLEKQIGHAESTNEVAPIQPTLVRLERLLPILAEPNQLAAVSRRVKLLLADLDRASKASGKSGQLQSAQKRTTTSGQSTRGMGPVQSSTTQDTSEPATEADRQLANLYALIPRIDPVLPVIGPLLNRLHSLDALHGRAAAFDDTLRQLEKEERLLSDGHKEMDELVKILQENLAKQNGGIAANWEALQKRIQDVERRLEALNTI